jgi:hypothetical protein
MNPVEQEPQKTAHVGIDGANTKGSRANGRQFRDQRINVLFGRSDSLPTYSMG